MLLRYPQIKNLYGYDPDQKWQTLACVAVVALVCVQLKPV